MFTVSLDESTSSGHFLGGPSPPPVTLPPTGDQSGSMSGGWSPRVAAAVWLRMLSVMGNINDIRDPAIHAEAMLGFYHIWTVLNKVGEELDSGWHGS